MSRVREPWRGGGVGFDPFVAGGDALLSVTVSPAGFVRHGRRGRAKVRPKATAKATAKVVVGGVTPAPLPVNASLSMTHDRNQLAANVFRDSRQVPERPLATPCRLDQPWPVSSLGFVHTITSSCGKRQPSLRRA